MLPNKLSPFTKKKKPKPKPKRAGVVGSLLDLGKELVGEAAVVPKDLVKTGLESIGAKTSPQHSRDVSNFLYEGKSLTPMQRAKLEQQDKSQAVQGISEQQAILRQEAAKKRSFAARRARLEAQPQREMSVQERLARQDQQDRQIEQEKQASKPTASIVLPKSSRSKQQGIKFRLKKKRQETAAAFKRSG